MKSSPVEKCTTPGSSQRKLKKTLIFFCPFSHCTFEGPCAYPPSCCFYTPHLDTHRLRCGPAPKSPTPAWSVPVGPPTGRRQAAGGLRGAVGWRRRGAGGAGGGPRRSTPGRGGEAPAGSCAGRGVCRGAAVMGLWVSPG